MTTEDTRAEVVRSAREQAIERELNAQLTQMRTRGDLTPPMRPEGRCRVCQTEDTRKLVNRLLSHGLAYTEILGILEPINANRRKNAKITYNSVRCHAIRHFNVQEPARSLYRTILEKRAKESEEDYIEGIGHHVNHLSYLETMMVKGYKELVSEEQNVTVRDGMDAAVKLHKLVQVDAGAQKAAEQLHQMNKIIAAVKEVVPEHYFAAIVARLEDPDLASTEPDVVDVDEVDDEEFDPEEDVDPRDDLD